MGTLELHQAEASPCHYIPTKEQSIKHGATELLDISVTPHTSQVTLHYTSHVTLNGGQQIRAGNEPSRILKFHNNKEGLYYCLLVLSHLRV